MSHNLLYILAFLMSAPSTDLYYIKDSKAQKEVPVVTSEKMKVVLAEIEEFTSGTAGIIRYDTEDGKSARSESTISPVIVFDRSIAILNISSGQIILVENNSKSKERPEIKKALILFVSSRGVKNTGEISEEDSTKLIETISQKFQYLFTEKPALNVLTTRMTT